MAGNSDRCMNGNTVQCNGERLGITYRKTSITSWIMMLNISVIRYVNPKKKTLYSCYYYYCFLFHFFIFKQLLRKWSNCIYSKLSTITFHEAVLTALVTHSIYKVGLSNFCSSHFSKKILVARKTCYFLLRQQT